VKFEIVMKFQVPIIPGTSQTSLCYLSFTESPFTSKATCSLVAESFPLKVCRLSNRSIKYCVYSVPNDMKSAFRMTMELRHLLRDAKRRRSFSVFPERYEQYTQFSVPEEVLSQIDQKKPLENSINSYARHFALSTGQ
jgi:hypothetical protein